MEFADTAESEAVGGFELGECVFVGKDGGEANKAIGGVGDPLGDDLVVPAAGVFVLPVPTEEDGLMNSGGIHSSEHVPGVGVILNAGLPVRCDEIGPMGFASCFCPDAWVFPQGGGEGMGVGVDYVEGWHWLMTGVCRVVACGLGRF